MSKRINANEYRDAYFAGPYNVHRLEGDCLYSYKSRVTPTKITPDDLPESFVCIWAGFYKRYVNAAGIKSVVYKPNYVFNHIYKDDFLYLSYDKEIEVNKNADFRFGQERIQHEDVWVWGNDIVPMAKAIQKYSGLDMSEILEEMEKKRKWYDDADGYPEADFEKHSQYFGVNYVDVTPEDEKI